MPASETLFQAEAFPAAQAEPDARPAPDVPAWEAGLVSLAFLLATVAILLLT